METRLFFPNALISRSETSSTPCISSVPTPFEHANLASFIRVPTYKAGLGCVGGVFKRADFRWPRVR